MQYAGVSGAACLMAVKNDCHAYKKHSARHSGLRPGVHSASATGIVAWKPARRHIGWLDHSGVFYPYLNDELA